MKQEIGSTFRLRVSQMVAGWSSVACNVCLISVPRYATCESPTYSSTGYGNWPTNGENGGRYFSTASFIWEAHGTPGSHMGWAPWPGIYVGWRRMVQNLQSIGEQISMQNYSVPLLSADRDWLSTPVTDPLVTGLCAKVHARSTELNLYM